MCCNGCCPTQGCLAIRGDSDRVCQFQKLQGTTSNQGDWLVTRCGAWCKRRYHFDGESDNRRRVRARRTRSSGVDRRGWIGTRRDVDGYRRVRIGFVAGGYRNCGARRRSGGTRCGWRARASGAGGDLRTARPRYGACETGRAGSNGSRRTGRACPRRIGYFGNDQGKSVAGRASVSQQLFGGGSFVAHRYGARP
ncbi:hypothetical protein DR64_5452 [Paraburkholderia xenovorans LB400]|nr:hypothetical protein DR64_5452 [Paraburkholderia xenovorans LB400]